MKRVTTTQNNVAKTHGNKIWRSVISTRPRTLQPLVATFTPDLHVLVKHTTYQGAAHYNDITEHIPEIYR